MTDDAVDQLESGAPVSKHFHIRVPEDAPSLAAALAPLPSNSHARVVLSGGTVEEHAPINVTGGMHLEVLAEDQEHRPFVSWSAGDGFVIKSGTLHVSGLEMQIQGGRNLAVVRASGVESIAEVCNCTLVCKADGSDASPYPKRVAACGIASNGAQLKMANCSVSALTPLARGIVCFGRGTSVEAENCTFDKCGSSACWCREAGALAKLENCTVSSCGGYGAVYATNGGRLMLKSVLQQGNDHGYGVMVLHEGSHVEAFGCNFNRNLWAGVGVRWSGTAHVEDCEICGNGAAGFQVRGSCMAGVRRINNREEGNYADPQFGKVYSNDPAHTSVPSKGVPSRGVTRSSVSRSLQ